VTFHYATKVQNMKGTVIKIQQPTTIMVQLSTGRQKKTKEWER
jgi:hypothetical protein